MKSTLAGGVAFVVTQVPVRTAEGAFTRPNPSWASGPGEVRHRIDGIPKVTGEKIYARDFLAADMPGWPAKESTVMILRAPFADRKYAGYSLSRLPPELKPDHVVTASDLKRDHIGVADPDYPEGMYIVPEGNVPDHRGMPVAMLFFSDWQKYEAAKKRLQFQKGVVLGGAPAEGSRKYVYKEPTSVVRMVKNDQEWFSNMQGGFPNRSGKTAHDLEAQKYIAEINEELKSNKEWDVYQQQYSTQIQDPMFMEPESGLGWYDRETKTLHLVIGTQSPYSDVESVANLFAGPDCPFDVKTVQMQACYPGGGFGGRDTSILCVYLALAALYSDEPIRVVYDRFEQFATGVKRHATEIDLTVAVSKHGLLEAVRDVLDLNGGGRINVSRYVAQVAGILGTGGYYVPKVDIWSRAFHTHSLVAGSMRGFGGAQACFAIETMMDEVAMDQGWDPIEFRHKNVVWWRHKVSTGAPVGPPALPEITERAMKDRLWRNREKDKAARSKGDIRYGVGFALGMKNFGTGADGVLGAVSMDPKGELHLTTHAVDMGTGTATALAAAPGPIVGANASTIDLGAIQEFEVLKLETGFKRQPHNPRWTPIGFMSTKAASSANQWRHAVDAASRVLFTTGLFPAARSLWGAKADSITEAHVSWSGSELTCSGFPSIPVADLAKKAHADKRVVSAMVHAFFSAKWVNAKYTVDGITRRWLIDALAVQHGGSSEWQLLDREDPELYSVQSEYEGNGQRFGASGLLVAVEVNVRTGNVKIVEGYQTLGPGKILQEPLLFGQMEGGFAMGVGYALTEELPDGPEGDTDGKWNLNRYHVALMTDVALQNFRREFIPPPKVKDLYPVGCGEVVFVPVAPAIVNAISHATGHRFRSLPVTPEKIRAAMGA